MEDPCQACIDLIGCDRDILNNAGKLRQFMVLAVELMGMTAFGNPQLFFIEGPTTDQSGFSGFQIITESHLAFHCYGEHNFIYICLFSCRTFDQVKLLQFAETFFKAEKGVMNVVQRTPFKKPYKPAL